jgi:hypothetical protein
MPIWVMHGAAAGGPQVAALAAVTVDQTGTPQLSGSSITSFDFTGMSVSSGLTNSALVISVLQTQAGGAIGTVAATWDNAGTPQAMTLIANVAVSSQTVWLFGLRAPHAGAGLTCHVTWNGNSQVSVNGISFFNVNQTSDAAAFPNSNTNSGSGTTASVAVSSAAQHIAVASHSSTFGFSSNSGTLWPTGGGIDFGGRGNYDVGAASVTLTATGPSGTLVSVGIDVSN